MLWLPAVSADVAHVALPALTACAVQPAMETPLLVKPTVPLGALPVTVAVSVTLTPNVDGLSELVTAVVVAEVTLTVAEFDDVVTAPRLSVARAVSE